MKIRKTLPKIENNKDRITYFQGEYRFLSNFYNSPIIIDGINYPTVEHYYQAMKSLDLGYRELVRSCSTPGDTKRLGKSVVLREDWESIKISIMYEGVRAKFSQNRDLLEKLKATGNAELIEGNTWNDTFWGVSLYTFEGRNELGKILMRLRKELSSI